MSAYNMELRLFKAAEALGWTVRYYAEDSSVEFSKGSPAGEDFSFEVSVHSIVEEVRSYADAFDTNEHIKLWANSAGENGVPNFKELVEDADAIDEMLEELAATLEANKPAGYIVASVGYGPDERKFFESCNEAYIYLALLKSQFKAAVSDAVPCDIYDVEKPDEVTIKQDEFFATAFIVEQPKTVKERLEFELRLARAAIDEDEVLDAKGENVSIALDRIAAIISSMS